MLILQLTGRWLCRKYRNGKDSRLSSSCGIRKGYLEWYPNVRHTKHLSLLHGRKIYWEIVVCNINYIFYWKIFRLCFLPGILRFFDRYRQVMISILDYVFNTFRRNKKIIKLRWVKAHFKIVWFKFKSHSNLNHHFRP